MPVAASLLVSLLAAIWGARGEPPGPDRHITAGAVIRFPADSTAEDKADAVQGLRYFATGTSNIVPQQLVVYPGPVVGAGHILIPAQVGQAAIHVSGYGTQSAQVLPVPGYGSDQLPTHTYGNTQQTTSVLYGSSHPLPQGGGVLPQEGGVLHQGGGVLHQGGGVLHQGGGVLHQGGGMLHQGGGVLHQGGGVLHQGGGVYQQAGGVLQQGGGVLPQGGGVLHQGSGVLHQGGGILHQGGVLQVSFPSNQQAANIPSIATPTPYPSTQQTAVPGVAYTVTQAVTPSTPYGTQPPHAIYQEGVKPLAPGFLYPTPPTTRQPTPPQLHEDHSHADVDLTYDSLGSSSSSQGDSYNILQNLVSHTTPGGKLTSPPPMKAATYGPPKPLHGLYARHRRPSYVVDAPHYHPVYKGLMSPYYHFHHPHGSHRHPTSTVVLKPSLYHLKHSSAAYEHQAPRAAYLPVPSYAKPTYYPHAALGGYAPTHGYHLVGKSDMDDVREQAIGSGEAVMHGQDDGGYSTIVGTYYEDGGRLRQSASKAPVIVYKGVRPPVKVYQKPELAGKRLQQSHYYRGHNLDRSDHGETLTVDNEGQSGGSTLAPFQSNWMPINAPEGAVPAKTYEMEVPDLSTGGVNHQSLPRREGAGVERQVSSLDRSPEEYFRQRNVYDKGNSEEVVSAVVMVKQ